MTRGSVRDVRGSAWYGRSRRFRMAEVVVFQRLGASVDDSWRSDGFFKFYVSFDCVHSVIITISQVIMTLICQSDSFLMTLTG